MNINRISVNNFLYNKNCKPKNQPNFCAMTKNAANKITDGFDSLEVHRQVQVLNEAVKLAEMAKDSDITIDTCDEGFVYISPRTQEGVVVPFEKFAVEYDGVVAVTNKQGDFVPCREYFALLKSVFNNLRNYSVRYDGDLRTKALLISRIENCISE